MNTTAAIRPSATNHIAVIDGQLTTTTQDIADVYGKQHKNVMQIVNQRIADAGEWGVLNFQHTPYTNPQNGQTYPVIRMTEKGFMFVVGKFTGAKAVQHQIAYVDEFERMKAALRAPAKPAKLASTPNAKYLARCMELVEEVKAYIRYLPAMPKLPAPDSFTVTSHELAAVVDLQVARALANKKYHYPRELLEQEYFITKTIPARLDIAMLSDATFKSPTQDLLTQLTREGHDVSACRVEYAAMHEHLKRIRQSLDELNGGVIRILYNPSAAIYTKNETLQTGQS